MFNFNNKTKRNLNEELSSTSQTPCESQAVLGNIVLRENHATECLLFLSQLDQSSKQMNKNQRDLCQVDVAPWIDIKIKIKSSKSVGKQKVNKQSYNSQMRKVKRFRVKDKENMIPMNKIKVQAKADVALDESQCTKNSHSVISRYNHNQERVNSPTNQFYQYKPLIHFRGPQTSCYSYQNSQAVKQIKQTKQRRKARSKTDHYGSMFVQDKQDEQKQVLRERDESNKMNHCTSSFTSPIMNCNSQFLKSETVILKQFEERSKTEYSVEESKLLKTKILRQTIKKSFLESAKQAHENTTSMLSNPLQIQNKNSKDYQKLKRKIMEKIKKQNFVKVSSVCNQNNYKPLNLKHLQGKSKCKGLYFRNTENLKCEGVQVGIEASNGLGKSLFEKYKLLINKVK